MVRGQTVPLPPTEVHGRADGKLQPVEDLMPEKVAAPKEGWVSLGSLHCCSSVPGGLQYVGGTHTGTVCEEMKPKGRIHVGESSWRTVSCERDPTLEQGKMQGVLPLWRKEWQD